MYYGAKYAFIFSIQSESIFFSSVVYLNVTDLKTYQVGWDTFCVKWSPHRAATSYRLKLSPADGMCQRKQTEPGVETPKPAAMQVLFINHGDVA